MTARPRRPRPSPGSRPGAALHATAGATARQEVRHGQVRHQHLPLRLALPDQGPRLPRQGQGHGVRPGRDPHREREGPGLRQGGRGLPAHRAAELDLRGDGREARPLAPRPGGAEGCHLLHEALHRRRGRHGRAGRGRAAVRRRGTHLAIQPGAARARSRSLRQEPAGGREVRRGSRRPPRPRAPEPLRDELHQPHRSRRWSSPSGSTARPSSS